MEFRNALSVGSRIERYEIEAIIGHGGFGISYRAVDCETGEQIALKEYLPSELATRESDDSVCPLSESHLDNFQWGLDRFLDEVDLLARFRHPNIVHVDRAFKANGTAYMVMAYEQGESLATRLHNQGTLTSDALVAMAMPLLDGLELVHEAGFIHRDIKPSNIYLRRDATPVLLDFGSARQALKGKTRTLTALVSAGYAPLEQYFSRSDLQGPWTDIYGFAATLYHAIAGEPPIDAVERSRGVLGSTRDILVPASEAAVGDFPPYLLAAVDHGLRVDDQDRPRSIAEWRRELTGEAPVPASPATSLETPVTEAAIVRRRRTGGKRAGMPRLAVGLAAAALAMVAAVLGWQQWPAAHMRLDGERAASRPLDGEPSPGQQIAELRRSLADARSAGEASRRQIDTLTRKLREQQAANETTQRRAEDSDAQARQRDGRVAELTAALQAAQTESERAYAKIRELAARLQELEALREQKRQQESSQAQEIEAMLVSADDDLSHMRLTTPPGNNAYEKYLRVLELDDGNTHARLGFERIVDKYIELAERARGNGRLDDAERLLNRGASVLPGSSRLATARQELDDIRRARRRMAVAAAESADAVANRLQPGDDAGTATSSDDATGHDARARAQPGPLAASASPAPTAKTSIAIFPGGGSYHPSGASTRMLEQLGRRAGAIIAASDEFELRYSYYARSADNSIAIPDATKVWQGFGTRRQLDESKLLAMGRQYGLDALLVASLDLGPRQGNWGGDFTNVNVEYRIFDVATSTYLIRQSKLDDSGVVLRACIEEFQREQADRKNAPAVATGSRGVASPAPVAAAPPAPLRTVIFPTSAAGWSLFTHVIVPDIVRQLKAYVGAEQRLTLAYSFYDDAAPGQTESPVYWNGIKALKQPDIPAIVAKARELGADVAIAVSHWNTDGTVSNIYATRVHVHMIDVDSELDYVMSGNGAEIAELAKNALARLDAARSELIAGKSDVLLN